MCFVQYMPIKRPFGFVAIPENLCWTKPVVETICSVDEYNYRLERSYIYLTVKHLYVERGSLGSRPGWHIDGFLSDDQNFVWCDKNPTEYVPSLDSYTFSQDHEKALHEMKLADIMTIHEIPVNAVVDLERTVHRTKEDIEPGLRTFIKVSVSEHKYNLQGNAHNYLIPHGWKMYPREKARNHPYVLEE